MINGVRLIDGTAETFNVEDIESLDGKTLYLIRTHEDASDGYIYFNGKKYGTGFGAKQFAAEYVDKLVTNTELKFFCVEDVTVTINGESTVYAANTLVDIFLRTDDDFEVTTTSDSSIKTLYAWPKTLDTFYSWLEGVNVFDGILFDMNDIEMYSKWNQGNQGLYKVQYAQYVNCVFWSDNPYISTLSARTNYTLYYTSQLPLLYSTIPENTFKSFYMAYGVTNDPNWSNPVYRNSFSMATYATQAFSYYGGRTIGMYDMDSSEFNIPLPPDCRGLMFYAPAVEHAGVFDAINTTNFGAKSGSWRDAFAYCHSLKTLYIKNLKVNINVSWSPISNESIDYIISEAANTKAITIYVSPYTYNRLTADIFSAATEKNITISLISANYTDDLRFSSMQQEISAMSDTITELQAKIEELTTKVSDINTAISLTDEGGL